MRRSNHTAKPGFVRRHSLTLVTAALLVLWLVLYQLSAPDSHIGLFFGNAIADWAGLLVTILGTKYLVESHSAESHKPNRHKGNKVFGFFYRHSLLLFIGVTGVLWAIAYSRMDANGKWGQVVGNIVSDWVEIGGLIFLTKGLIEKARKKAADCYRFHRALNSC